MRLLSFFSLLLLCWTLSLSDSALAQMQPAGGNARNQNDAQKAGAESDEDPCIEIDDHRTCWTMDPITGIRHEQVPDTSYLNISARETMEGKSMSLVHTGNLFSPHYITNFFDRRDRHDYLFLNAYSLFAYRPEDLVFYDTKLPYTTAAYTTSGSSVRSNDHLRINFAGNVNKKIGVGTFLDYVYARGEFTSQATKPLKWTSYLYYNDDQYKATLSFNISKLANQENGGVQNREWTLNPDKYSKTSYLIENNTMPTNLKATWNDMDGMNVHFNHSYDLGFWEEYANPADSTEMLENFTSVASIFHSIDVEHYNHEFRMDSGADQTDLNNFFPYNYIDASSTLDSTSYTSLTTYAGLRLNEGFNKYSQFGLSAFIGYQLQRYTLMQQYQDEVATDFMPRHHSSHNVFVGGQLSRHLSSILTFDVTARIGLTNDKQGEIDITGQLQTVIPAGKNDSITVQAMGYFRNQKNPYLLEHYYSNHFLWNKTMSDERRTHIEGNFRYSLTGTEAKVGIENISNYHYFTNTDSIPLECGERIQVFSAEISQKLHWKAIHWDNKVLFQTSTRDDVLPLPKFSIQSDLSLRFVIAHALTTQLGITGYYTSKYYAPSYQPATQQFVVQNDYECGGYPQFNAYVNCNLKKLKFFVMYTNIGTNMKSNDTFLMPYYPLQSSRLQYGVIFDLQD